MLLKEVPVTYILFCAFIGILLSFLNYVRLANSVLEAHKSLQRWLVLMHKLFCICKLTLCTYAYKFVPIASVVVVFLQTVIFEKSINLSFFFNLCCVNSKQSKNSPALFSCSAGRKSTNENNCHIFGDLRPNAPTAIIYGLS